MSENIQIALLAGLIFAIPTFGPILMGFVDNLLDRRHIAKCEAEAEGEL